MKKINILLTTVLFASLLIGCDGVDESEVLLNRKISGVSISVEGEGSIQGEPSDLEDLTNSSVTIMSNNLFMSISKLNTEDESNIEGYEVIKQFNGGEEIIIATSENLPFEVNLTELSEFLEGTNISENDLKIGDVFTFSVKVLNKDEKKYIYSSQAFNITVNCFADLTGVYSVTNSICGTGLNGKIPSIQITKTPDGKWKLETADGGLLQYCTSNTSLVNSGTISVICGEVSGTTDFCPDYGIGCIKGGKWDAETGTLTIEYNDAFFDNGDYTATYTRE